MLEEFHFTLPPDTTPLDDEHREEQIRRRQDALVEASLKLRNAERTRLL